MCGSHYLQWGENGIFKLAIHVPQCSSLETERRIERGKGGRVGGRPKREKEAETEMKEKGEEGGLEKGKGTYKDMHTLLITTSTSPQPPSNTYLTDMQPTRNDPSLKDIPGKLHPLWHRWHPLHCKLSILQPHWHGYKSPGKLNSKYSIVNTKHSVKAQ